MNCYRVVMSLSFNGLQKWYYDDSSVVRICFWGCIKEANRVQVTGTMIGCLTSIHNTQMQAAGLAASERKGTR